MSINIGKPEGAIGESITRMMEGWSVDPIISTANTEWAHERFTGIIFEQDPCIASDPFLQYYTGLVRQRRANGIRSENTHVRRPRCRFIRLHPKSGTHVHCPGKCKGVIKDWNGMTKTPNDSQGGTPIQQGQCLISDGRTINLSNAIKGSGSPRIEREKKNTSGRNHFVLRWWPSKILPSPSESPDTSIHFRVDLKSEALQIWIPNESLSIYLSL